MASKRIVVLGGREAVARMRLAGVREAYVLDSANVEEVYGKIGDSGALFFITKEAGALLGSRLEELKGKSIVQIIPEPAEEYTAAKDLIKDTIGFLI